MSINQDLVQTEWKYQFILTQLIINPFSKPLEMYKFIKNTNLDIIS